MQRPRYAKKSKPLHCLRFGLTVFFSKVFVYHTIDAGCIGVNRSDNSQV